MLNREERNRYDRQLRIEDLGEVGQEKLKRSKVFISGLGGLGSVITLYLTAVGVGVLRVVDEGEVELSNLNRQILYCDKDIGKKKAKVAKKVLERLNPYVKIEGIAERIKESNAVKLVEDSNVIIDALDNYATRYILNKVALRNRIPFFFGAVSGFRGMVTTLLPGETGCLRCIVPHPPPPSLFPIIGVTPAMIGCIQATEVIKYITGVGKLLSNRLLLFNGLNLKFDEITFKKNLNCPDCGRIKE
jgi:adenylyltransferase/sulfurtransferase